MNKRIISTLVAIVFGMLFTLLAERKAMLLLDLQDELSNPFSVLKHWNTGIKQISNDQIVLIGEIQLNYHEIIYSNTGQMYLIPQEMTNSALTDSLTLSHGSCYLLQVVSPLSTDYPDADKFAFPSLSKSLLEERYMTEKKFCDDDKEFIKSILSFYHTPRAYFLYLIRKRIYDFNSYFIHNDMHRRWKIYPIKSDIDDNLYIRVVCPIW